MNNSVGSNPAIPGIAETLMSSFLKLIFSKLLNIFTFLFLNLFFIFFINS